MEYPYECCRCGFCCLSETCPIGREFFGVCVGRCPALSFNGDEATCAIAPEYVPVGDGCCISARCFKDGQVYDFASLSSEMKKRLAQNLKEEVDGS